MGGDDDDGSPSRNAIPLVAGAIVLAQTTMAISTWIGDRLTFYGIGRKPLFMAGLATLPIRCALIILLKNAGDAYLLSTQVLDGIGGGLGGLILPYLIADITFGSGRFNMISKFVFCFVLAGQSCRMVKIACLLVVCIDEKTTQLFFWPVYLLFLLLLLFPHPGAHTHAHIYI